VLLDIGPFKLVTLVVLAVVIFGPDKLPQLVADAMRLFRAVRAFSDSATQDIREELGPEFADFEITDLNPRTFVRKQLDTHGEALGLTAVRDLAQDIGGSAADVPAVASPRQPS